MRWLSIPLGSIATLIFCGFAILMSREIAGQSFFALIMLTVVMSIFSGGMGDALRRELTCFIEPPGNLLNWVKEHGVEIRGLEKILPYSPRQLFIIVDKNRRFYYAAAIYSIAERDYWLELKDPSLRVYWHLAEPKEIAKVSSVEKYAEQYGDRNSSGTIANGEV